MVERELMARQAQWLREVHGITVEEAQNSPASTQAALSAEWARYWRAECEAGRGITMADHSHARPGRRVA